MSEHPNGKISFFLSVSYRKQRNQFHPSHVRLRQVRNQTVLLKSEVHHPLYRIMEPNFKASAKPAAQGDSSDLDYTVTWEHKIASEVSLLSRGLGYRVEVEKIAHGSQVDCKVIFLVDHHKIPSSPIQYQPGYYLLEFWRTYFRSQPLADSAAIEVAFDGIRVLENRALVFECAHFNKLLDPESLRHPLVQSLLDKEYFKLYDYFTKPTDANTKSFNDCFAARTDYWLGLAYILCKDPVKDTTSESRTEILHRFHTEMNAVDKLFLRHFQAFEYPKLPWGWKKTMNFSVATIRSFLSDQSQVSFEKLEEALTALGKYLQAALYIDEVSESIHKVISQNLDDLDLATHLYSPLLWNLDWKKLENSLNSDLCYSMYLKAENSRTKSSMCSTDQFVFYMHPLRALMFGRKGSDEKTHRLIDTRAAFLNGNLSGDPIVCWLDQDRILLTVKGKIGENRWVFDLAGIESELNGPDSDEEQLMSLNGAIWLPELRYSTTQTQDYSQCSAGSDTEVAVLTCFQGNYDTHDLWLYYLPGSNQTCRQWVAFDAVSYLHQKLKKTFNDTLKIRLIQKTWLLVRRKTTSVFFGCKIDSLEYQEDEEYDHLYLACFEYLEDQKCLVVKSEVLFDTSGYQKHIGKSLKAAQHEPVLAVWSEVRGKYFSILCERDGSLVICHCYWQNRFVLIGRQNRNARGIFVLPQSNQSSAVVPVWDGLAGLVGMVNLMDTGRVDKDGHKVYKCYRLQPSF